MNDYLYLFTHSTTGKKIGWKENIFGLIFFGIIFVVSYYATRLTAYLQEYLYRVPDHKIFLPLHTSGFLWLLFSAFFVLLAFLIIGIISLIVLEKRQKSYQILLLLPLIFFNSCAIFSVFRGDWIAISDSGIVSGFAKMGFSAETRKFDWNHVAQIWLSNDPKYVTHEYSLRENNGIAPIYNIYFNDGNSIQIGGASAINDIEKLTFPLGYKEIIVSAHKNGVKICVDQEQSSELLKKLSKNDFSVNNRIKELFTMASEYSDCSTHDAIQEKALNLPWPLWLKITLIILTLTAILLLFVDKFPATWQDTTLVALFITLFLSIGVLMLGLFL